MCAQRSNRTAWWMMVAVVAAWGCEGAGVGHGAWSDGVVPASTGATEATPAWHGVEPRVARGPVRASWAPRGFVPNMGQADPEVVLAAMGDGHALFATAGELVLVVRDGGRVGDESPVLRLVPLGGRPGVPEGIDETATRVSWFTGNRPSAWAENLPVYRGLRYPDVAQGMDLEVYPNGNAITFTWVLAPGADPAGVGLDLEGASRVIPEDDGAVSLTLGRTRLRLSPPRRYPVDEESAGLEETWGVTTAGGRVAFSPDLGEVLPLPLSVSTTLTFSTVVGGSQDDTVTATAVGPDGSIVLVGQTWSPDFPVGGSGLDQTFNGMNTDGYVARIDPSGARLLSFTFLGGSTGGTSGYVGWDMIRDVAMDARGDIYLVGYTYATDFPTTPGAFQPGFAGGYTDIFACKLSSTADEIRFSTYLGGTDNEAGESVAVDSTGRLILAGYSYSSDFPVSPEAFQTSNRGYADMIVARLSLDGAHLEASTFVGGSAGSSGGWGDYGKAVAVAPDGRMFVAGHTLSSDFPVSSDAAQWSRADSYDGFLVVLSSDARRLEYATYFGGSGMDTVSGLALDPHGTAHLVGATTSTDFPVTPGAFMYAAKGGTDAFLIQIDPAIPGPDGILSSTYLGGTGADQARDVTMDTTGDAWIAGSTTSLDLPIEGSVFQESFGGGDSDGFVARVASDGAVVLVSYLGGGGYDIGVAIASAANGAVVVGTTQSSDFSTTESGPQAADASSSNTDVFVSRIETQPILPTFAPW